MPDLSLTIHNLYNTFIFKSQISHVTSQMSYIQIVVMIRRHPDANDAVYNSAYFISGYLVRYSQVERYWLMLPSHRLILKRACMQDSYPIVIERIWASQMNKTIELCRITMKRR